MLYLFLSQPNLVECTRFFGGSNGPNNAIAYRAVPWIGMHQSNLQRTQRTTLCLLLAFFYFLVITYIFYGACFSVWDKLFFGERPTMMNDGQNYYPYLELLELLMLVYIRTRVSILYFPKIVSIMNVLYLFYCFTNFFPFVGLAGALLTFSTMVVFLLFLKYCELPTVEWNPFAFHTPSLNNPRQVYAPTLQSRFSLGFDLWSIFYVPSLRSEFIPEEQTEIGTEAEPIQFDFSGEGENNAREVINNNHPREQDNQEN